MKTINYKGKGEHSVRELELIIEQQAEEIHLLKSGQKQLPIHGVIPRSFYVVAKTYETGEDLAQLSNALDSYERAKTFRYSKFNKERYPNAFIVSSLNEV